MADNEPQKQGEQNEQADRLLRQWGAERAQAEADIGQPPAVDTRTAGPSWTASRWVSVAAALLLVVCVLILVALTRTEPGAPTETTNEAADEIRRLKTDLARTEASLSTVRSNRDKLKELLDARAKDIKEVDETRRKLADATARADKLAADLDLARKQADAKERALAQQIADLKKQADPDAKAALEKQIAALAAELEKQKTEAARAADKLKAAEAELARRTDDAARLAALESERAAALKLLRESYLRTAGPGPVNRTIRERQEAARRHDLVARGRELKRVAKGTPAAELIAALDLLLVKLDILDAADARAAKRFGEVLDQVRLAERLDAVRRTDQPPAVRQWLLEAELVLTGA